MNVQFVVARFEEDVSWLMREQFKPFLENTIVYNKGKTEIPHSVARAVKAVVPLPNVGKCDHTYLHHIVTHSETNTLAEYTVFVPGSLFSSTPDKLLRIRDIFNFLHTRLPIPMVVGNVREMFYNFMMGWYPLSSTSPDRHECKETLTKPAPVRPMGPWIDSVLGPHNADITHCPTMYRGVFCGSRDSIALTPLDVFRTLLQQCGEHVNPEVGHYIERMWGYLACRGMLAKGEVVPMLNYNFHAENGIVVPPPPTTSATDLFAQRQKATNTNQKGKRDPRRLKVAYSSLTRGVTASSSSSSQLRSRASTAAKYQSQPRRRVVGNTLLTRPTARAAVGMARPRLVARKVR